MVPTLDEHPSFEQTDIEGTTKHFIGTVGTTPISLPSVSGNQLAEVFIKNPISNTGNKTLFYSLDGGVNFATLSIGEFFGWSVKSLYQIQIKGSTSAVSYEVILNIEDFA